MHALFITYQTQTEGHKRQCSRPYFCYFQMSSFNTINWLKNSCVLTNIQNIFYSSPTNTAYDASSFGVSQHSWSLYKHCTWADTTKQWDLNECPQKTEASWFYAEHNNHHFTTGSNSAMHTSHWRLKGFQPNRNSVSWTVHDQPEFTEEKLLLVHQHDSYWKSALECSRVPETL